MPADNRVIRSAGAAPAAEIIIAGAGLAGLFLALSLRPRPCLVISPGKLGEAASSAWAQGGLAAALDPEDSPEAHASDTEIAGAGLVDPAIARLIAEAGPARVLDLIALGVPFDRTPEGALALSLEAAHSRPRVARVAGDLAGKAIMEALVAAVRASPSIIVLEQAWALGLLQGDDGAVTGIIAQSADGDPFALPAAETVLCTGGLGGLYRVTTNPMAARGDALAMAWTAGAMIADPEFVQFHPTAMDVGRDPAPLATEALRGEGARLINTDGTPFMIRYHRAGELAPRDEVARAIQSELLAGRGAFLDASTAVGTAFPEHFPTVFACAMAAGIDPRIRPIPVAPAAHYHMGGVASDLWGQSTVSGLSVCGECAATGAHGANRLASNSLLESLVFADRIAQRLRGADLPACGDGAASLAPRLDDAVFQALRGHMSAACGVVRDAEGLAGVLAWIDETGGAHGPAAPLRVARLIAAAALARRESRGGHYRRDAPQPVEPPRRTFLAREGDSADMAS